MMRHLLISAALMLFSPLASAGPISAWRTPVFCSTLLIDHPRYFREEDATFSEMVVKARKKEVPFFFAKDEHGKVLMYAKDEREATLLLRDLQQWRRAKALPVKPDLKLNTATRFESGDLTLDVTDFAPSEVDFFQGRQAYDNGANCWEFACYLTGSVRSISGGMEASEFAYWLNSSAYSKILPGEVPQPGDLIAIRAKRAGSLVDEIHGAYYVSPRLLFSKNGLAYESPYLLQSADEVFGVYMPKLPKSCIDPRFWEKPGCHAFVEIYRSADMAAKSGVPIPPAVKLNEKLLKGFEKQMSDWWLLNQFPSKAQEKALAEFVKTESTRVIQAIDALQANRSMETALRNATIEHWKNHWGRVAHLAPLNPLAPWTYAKAK